MSDVILSEIIAPAFKEIHKDVKKCGHTHYWLSGGRGSTKSSFIAIELILGIMSDPQANAVVLRKVKDTLNDSVKDQLIWAIEALGVGQYWDMPEAKLSLTYMPTGQEIRFRGADKPKKIKSMKFSRGYCKFIWFEELDEFTDMEEIRMINQSLMRGGKKFTVFYSYNPPRSANSWVNTEKKYTRIDRLVSHTNYLSVPREWLGEQFIIEAEHLKETKPLAYQHEYLGEVVGTGGEVFDNVQIRPISDDEIAEFTNLKRGLDFGYAADPLAYVAGHYDAKRKRLYIYHELFKVRMDLLPAYEHIKKENTRNEMIYADSAEPRSISQLAQYGLRVAGVKKGPGSIEYGVQFLQSLEAIVIDDKRCPETAREFLTYELERDANGNYKAGYPDKNNHSIDAVRYMMNDEAIDFRERKPKSNIHLTREEQIVQHINQLDRNSKKKKRGSDYAV